MNNDLISREALKKALHNFFDGKVIDEPTYILRDVFCYIDSAPTITPSLNLDDITEEDIEKFKIIWQRANSKGLRAIIEDKPQGDKKEALFVLNHLFYDCDNMTPKEYDILYKALMKG